jgi:cephalosporin hydroxylase
MTDDPYFTHKLKRALMKFGVIDRPLGSIEGMAMKPEEHDLYFQQPLTEFEDIVLGHEGRTIHKWAHYLPIYDRLFSPYRGRPVTFLEIGVNRGGSLEMWRRYFGAEAVIAGVDIDEECASRVDPPNRIFLGSQADPAFLEDVVAKIGAPDIVLDDGSHVAEHQRASFDTLFPLLKDGGLYLIEDTATAYWPDMYEGGYRRRGTAIEFAKDLVDDVNAWYHKEHFDPLIRDHVHSIAFYDSIIAIEKRRKLPPRHLFRPPPKS